MDDWVDWVGYCDEDVGEGERGRDGIYGCGGGPCELSDQKANNSNEQQRHMRMIPSKGLRCPSLSLVR